MSKDTFLHQLRIRLSQLPEAEIEKSAPPAGETGGRGGWEDIDDSLPLAEGRLREAAKGRECKVQERGGLTPPPP